MENTPEPIRPINDPSPSGKPEEQAPVKDPPNPQKEHQKQFPKPVQVTPLDEEQHIKQGIEVKET